LDMRNNNEGHQSSTNVVAKGGCGAGSPSHGRGGHNGGGRGGCGGFGRGGGGRGQGTVFQQGFFCQLCGKEGHAVISCFKLFDHSFISPP
jgi:hypothetical protein